MMRPDRCAEPPRPVSPAAAVITGVGFRGYPNVRPPRRATIEVTTDLGMAPAGGRIVGVGAECGCVGLPGPLKAALRDGRSRVRITLAAGGRPCPVVRRRRTGPAPCDISVF